MQHPDKITERLIDKQKTLLHALKQMDDKGFKALIVVNEAGSFEGVLSVGDIQRAILKNISFDSQINSILRPNPLIASARDPLSEIKKQMLEYRMEFMPVVNNSKVLEMVYFWDEVFLETKLPPKSQFNLPVVIMAGGFGTRLKPLTNVLPKPLIPFGNKTMLEEIFERYEKYGCNKFFISINYKAELIEFYLKNQNLPFELSFFREEKPMGTAGSLSLLKGKLNQTFFINNCDILIEQDYSEILDYHTKNKNEITIVAALKHIAIPYGTIETGENGQLVSLTEKPELTVKINSGMYLLEPHLLNEIPTNDFFHITHLIEKVKLRNGKVGVFPVSEKSWRDVGEWDEYLKAIREY